MIRPPFAIVLLAATLTTSTPAAATPAQDLARAYFQFDHHQWRPALALANAYLAANGRNYSAELIVAGSACKLHPHLKSNAAPFQKLRADYPLPPQQDRAVRDWIDICTSPPPQPQHQEAGVSASGLTVEPNTRIADPSSGTIPLRHPPQPPRVVASPVVAASGPVQPASCRALAKIAQNPASNPATVATLRNVCTREMGLAAPAVAAVPSPDAALPPEVVAANAERRRRDLAAVCRPPYVWRDAFAGDRVCVEPQVRDDAAADNARAAARRDPAGPYGPMTCIPGYVWRGARDGDTVCVVPQRRDQAAADNAAAASRRAAVGVPGSG